jgi:hypothetical protein
MTDAELADAPSPVLNRKVKSAAKQEARNLAFLVRNQSLMGCFPFERFFYGCLINLKRLL